MGICGQLSSGQAVVTLCGRDFYLGPFGTSASRHAYDRLIAEWSGNGRSLRVAGAEISVVELIAAYRHSSEYEATLLSLRPLKELYCRLLACEFSPLKLKAVRQKMIESDLCRNEVNKRIGRINAHVSLGRRERVGVAHRPRCTPGGCRTG